MSDDEEYKTDLATGRRVERHLSPEFMVALQYFPEWDAVVIGFYHQASPGYTVSMKTDQWPVYQKMVAGFNWRGRKQ